LPLLIFGAGGFDYSIHGLWAKNFISELGFDSLYPRHFPQLNYGLGEYFGFFYPPAIFYINSALGFLQNDEMLNYTLVIASGYLALILSAFACYRWLSSRYNNRQIALLASILYMLSPYLLINSYYFSALSQQWAFALFPLLMLTAEKIAFGKKRGVVLYAIAQALLFLTNIPMAIIFSGIPFIYLLALKADLRAFLKMASGAIFASCLAAFYLLPMLLLKKYVYIDAHFDWGLSYDKFFITQDNLSGGQTSFFALIMLELFFYSLVTAFLVLKINFNRLHKFILFGMAAVIFMQFPISIIFWENLPFLKYIQFPHRLLAISVVLLTLLFAEFLADKNSAERIKMLTAILVIPLIILTIFAAEKRSEPISNEARALYQKGLFGFNPHYVPKSEGMVEYLYGKDRAGIEQLPIIESKNRNADFEVIEIRNRHLEFKINAVVGDEMIIRQFYIPGWRAEINGIPVELLSEDYMQRMLIVIDKNYKDATLLLYLPKYWHERAGAWISLISLLILMLLFCYEKRLQK